MGKPSPRVLLLAPVRVPGTLTLPSRHVYFMEYPGEALLGKVGAAI